MAELAVTPILLSRDEFVGVYSDNMTISSKKIDAFRKN
jgi:hypothetical protein